MPKSRKLQYADRVAIQQADQAIRKDVLRALVEVITNANDSYSRLESGGTSVSGEIVIEIQRKYMNSMIRVRDFAEGMTDARMDKVVGTYGEATSGIKEDQNVRGMWGRGLKDAIFGLDMATCVLFKLTNIIVVLYCLRRVCQHLIWKMRLHRISFSEKNTVFTMAMAQRLKLSFRVMM